ncbi:YceI family protein [Litoribrevibacter euphylliae]|uniref:YceI family protein n=1 Tax=Litoribrevibacter euphylliae TaxID=1834034 RepID=A0ABV7HMW8_9GAMM
MKLGKITKTLLATSLASLMSMSAMADKYVIDTKGAHASIQFKIQHLGYSWLTGRFNDFKGEFTFDEKNLAASQVNVVIDTKSVDSNHAERDKHLRGNDFLDVSTYPKAIFQSTSVVPGADGSFQLVGDLTLHGVTKSVTIDANHIGGGNDPWGGFRNGFEGSTTIKLKDFGIDYNLGPASETVELELHVEGIRQ